MEVTATIRCEMQRRARPWLHGDTTGTLAAGDVAGETEEDCRFFVVLA